MVAVRSELPGLAVVAKVTLPSPTVMPLIQSTPSCRVAVRLVPVTGLETVYGISPEVAL